jgi:hypothetical protein
MSDTGILIKEIISRSAVRELAATLFARLTSASAVSCLSGPSLIQLSLESGFLYGALLQLFASRFSVGSCVVRVVSSP